MSHTSTLPDDKSSSPSKDDEIHDSPEQRELERFWATDLDWSAASFPELSKSRGIDQFLTMAAPAGVFRKFVTRSPNSNLKPERSTPDRTSRPMEEQLEAVEVDEALDNAQHLEHQQPIEQDELRPEQDELQPAQQVDLHSKRQKVTLAFSRWSSNQYKILQYRSREDKTNFAKAAADFASWKRLLDEISNPESSSPSFIERRILHDILQLDSVDSMRSFLSYSSPVHKQKARDRILLYTALRHTPEKAAMVLEALLSVSRIPFYMTEDSLGFLARNLRHMEEGIRQSCAQKLADVAVKSFQVRDKGSIHLMQNTVFCIMDALPPTQLEDWFQHLVAHEIPLHKYTLLTFASRFAKMSATKHLALDILRDLFETQSLDINTPLGTSLCTSLLTFKDDDLHAMDENSATPAEIFQCLLDLGLVPNVITYTCIIRSLCVKRELRTAMEVFEVMKQHGVQPDAHTYSVLMNGCKSCGDFGTMLRFAFEARAADVRDPVIWNDVIHATFVACLKEPRVPGGVRRARCVVWGPMNAIFTRFFDSEPLRSLITSRFSDIRDFLEMGSFIPSRMQGAFQEMAPLPPREVIQPTSSTLSLMVLGFVRHLPSPRDVVLFYDHFKELLKEGDPVAQSIVEEQGSIVHDIVLRALLKWKGTLRLMLDIVRDMMTDISPAAAATIPSKPRKSELETSDSPPYPATKTEEISSDLDTSEIGTDSTTAAADLTEAESEAASAEETLLYTTLSNADGLSASARPPIRHPRPSVHTWSILLKAFMTNRLPREGEHILKLMQLHGVKPNIVTWNTLAAEYARLGKTKQAVEAMSRLEAAGFKSDDFTMRAFSYISDKAKAIRLMEAKVEENKLAKAEMDELEQKLLQQQLPPREQAEAELDEFMNLEGELLEDLSDGQIERPEMDEEIGRWLSRDGTPSPGGDARPGVQDPSSPTEELRPVSRQATEAAMPTPPPPAEEAQKPVANAPVPAKSDLAAWDDFLWDHAAEPGPEEQDKREESAA